MVDDQLDQVVREIGVAQAPDRVRTAQQQLQRVGARDLLYAEALRTASAQQNANDDGT